MEYKIYYFKTVKFTIDPYYNKKISMDKKYMDDNYFHIYTGTLDEPSEDTHQNLQRIMSLFNSDNNPLSNSEYQMNIRSNMLHTSMSVNDVVFINGEFYRVDNFGFNKIKIKN